MTPKEIELLKRLITADREYRSKKERGELVHRDDRGVEVGKINGVDPRTARTLIDNGLAEGVSLTQNNWYVFLGSYNPYDDEAKDY